MTECWSCNLEDDLTTCSYSAHTRRTALGNCSALSNVISGHQRQEVGISEWKCWLGVLSVTWCVKVVAGSHHRCWQLKKRPLLLSMQNHPWLQRTVESHNGADRLTPIVLSLECLGSGSKPPDISTVYSKCSRCFPSAPCKLPWHIHPFRCYCARAQLLGEKRHTKKSAAGHCLFSRLSSVSKWSGKQTALKAHRSCVWRISGKSTVAEWFPFEEAACSVPPNTISQGRRTLPRMSKSNRFSTTRTET